MHISMYAILFFVIIAPLPSRTISVLIKVAISATFQALPVVCGKTIWTDRLTLILHFCFKWTIQKINISQIIKNHLLASIIGIEKMFLLAIFSIFCFHFVSVTFYLQTNKQTYKKKTARDFSQRCYMSANRRISLFFFHFTLTFAILTS